MFKKIIHNLLKLKGYKIVPVPSVELDLELGTYKWLQEFGIKTIIDVGANTGQFSNMISKILPNTKIYAFEPLRDCYAKLLENIKEINSIECFNLALGKEEGELEMFKNDFTPSSSLLKIKKTHIDLFPQTGEVSIEKIKVKTLSSFLDVFSLDSKVLLKIDVQGYEKNVLEGAEEFLEKVDMIIIESSFVSLYENQPLFPEVYSFLMKKNFRYNGGFDKIISPQNGVNVQEDSIFIKNQN